MKKVKAIKNRAKRGNKVLWGKKEEGIIQPNCEVIKPNDFKEIQTLVIGPKILAFHQTTRGPFLSTSAIF